MINSKKNPGVICSKLRNHPDRKNHTFTSMNEKGEPDVAAEQWANAVRDPLKKAVDEGRLHVINKAPITGLGKAGGYHLIPQKNILS